MSAIDISENFIGHASDEERRHPGRGSTHRTASAVSLPFGDASFHFATAFMSLMDMPEVERAVGEVVPGAEARRLLSVLDRAPVFRHTSSSKMYATHPG